MSGYVCVRSPGRVAWFESETDYYDGQPTFVMQRDPVQLLWYGRSYRPTTRAMTPSVGQVFRRLTNFPMADVSAWVTHEVAEPGAPLEPVTTEVTA